MGSYQTTLELNCADEYVELRAEVLFDYTPEQVEIIHPVDMSQEGIPASVSIYSVMVEPITDSQPIDIFYLLTEEMLDSLDEDILRYIQIQQENGGCP